MLLRHATRMGTSFHHANSLPQSSAGMVWKVTYENRRNKQVHK